MLTDISGNSFSVLSTGLDYNAADFIRAASITSTTEITAINNLVTQLKINNLWDKMQAIYPFVGGTSASTRFNLKDPRNADAAFRLTFVGNWTYSSTGIRASTLASGNYVRTFYNPRLNGVSNDVHVSSYIVSAITNAGVPIGCIEGGFGTNQIVLYASTVEAVAAIQISGGTTVACPTTPGFILGNRPASNSQQTYFNGSLFSSNTTTSTPLPNNEMFIANRNLLDRAHTAETRFATIGRSLTSTENSALYTIVQSFQTTLGRQVGASTGLFSNVQNALPTVTYNPKQLYGNDLYLWVDLTDWRNMYNTSGGSANISSIGCVALTGASDTNPNHTNVRRLEDLAGNFTGSNRSRKFYFYGGTLGVTTQQPDSSVTGNTNLFCNGQWDTNKGVFSGIAGNFDLRHPVTFSNPINFLAPRSAITLCNYLFLTDFTSIGGNNYTKGIVVPGLLFAVPAFGFLNPNLTTNLALNINSLTQWSGNWTTAYSQFNDRTVMLTAVLSGRGFSIYANTTLITSGTLTAGVTYPISGLSNNYIAFGRSEQASLGSAYQRVRPIWEGFIANAYTSPQQINLLYDYFRVKFKDRIGDLF